MQDRGEWGAASERRGARAAETICMRRRHGCARTAALSARAAPAPIMKTAMAPAASTSVRCCCEVDEPKRKARTQKPCTKIGTAANPGRARGDGQFAEEAGSPEGQLCLRAAKCCSAGNGEAMSRYRIREARSTAAHLSGRRRSPRWRDNSLAPAHRLCGAGTGADPAARAARPGCGSASRMADGSMW